MHWYFHDIDTFDFFVSAREVSSLDNSQGHYVFLFKVYGG